jgi:L-methionine (R)-S-oxide reductase
MNDSDKRDIFSELEQKIGLIIAETPERDLMLTLICELLAEGIPYYDWVGFYFVDSENPRELILGPYVGEATDHVRIKFGWGICGQAAEKEETFVIQDVREQENYLSCSIHVRSEIVVPMFRKETFIGEIDIDSHAVGPFTDEDTRFIERLAEMLSRTFD